MLEYVHNGCFGHACYDIVNHRAAHHLFDVLHGLHEIGSLHQIIDGGTLLFFGLLVECNELQFVLVPFVGGVQVAEKYLFIGGFGNTLHIKFATHVT